MKNKKKSTFNNFVNIGWLYGLWKLNNSNNNNLTKINKILAYYVKNK